MAVYNFRDLHLLYPRQLCYNAKSGIDILTINKWIIGEDFNSPHLYVNPLTPVPPVTARAKTHPQFPVPPVTARKKAGEDNCLSYPP